MQFKDTNRVSCVSVEILKEGAVLLHPMRFKIINALMDAGRAMYIDEVATAIGENRRLVSFHLSTLEERGYATSEFDVIKKPSSKGKAGKFYKLTPNVNKVLGDLMKILEKR